MQTLLMRPPSRTFWVMPTSHALGAGSGVLVEHVNSETLSSGVLSGCS